MTTETLQTLKDRAQFFKKGAIMPRRVMACSNRKLQHVVRFGSDSYVLPCKTGYLVMIPIMTVDDSAIIIKSHRQKRRSKTTAYQGSTYHVNGTGTHFIGRGKQSYEDFERMVLNTFEYKNGRRESCVL